MTEYLFNVWLSFSTYFGVCIVLSTLLIFSRFLSVYSYIKPYGKYIWGSISLICIIGLFIAFMSPTNTPKNTVQYYDQEYERETTQITEHIVKDLVPKVDAKEHQEKFDKLVNWKNK